MRLRPSAARPTSRAQRRSDSRCTPSVLIGLGRGKPDLALETESHIKMFMFNQVLSLIPAAARQRHLPLPHPPLHPLLPCPPLPLHPAEQRCPPALAASARREGEEKTSDGVQHRRQRGAHMQAQQAGCTGQAASAGSRWTISQAASQHCMGTTSRHRAYCHQRGGPCCPPAERWVHRDGTPGVAHCAPAALWPPQTAAWGPCPGNRGELAQQQNVSSSSAELQMPSAAKKF